MFCALEQVIEIYVNERLIGAIGIVKNRTIVVAEKNAAPITRNIICIFLEANTLPIPTRKETLA